MQMLKLQTKSSIDTKTVQRINSYFIDGASQRHFSNIFVNKDSFFIVLSCVGTEIWTLWPVGRKTHIVSGVKNAIVTFLNQMEDNFCSCCRKKSFMSLKEASLEK